MSGVEYSNQARNVDAYRSLAKAAGMSEAELADNIEAGGVVAACRNAVERAVKRRGDPRRALAELERKRISP